ncbi:hypothetical protein ABW20_dc0110420 [Dactylellina cionopaga]|nr:hypothetical protein ABW20_dc0110420 [Dactylellina cionopaga]
MCKSANYWSNSGSPCRTTICRRQNSYNTWPSGYTFQYQVNGVLPGSDQRTMESAFERAWSKWARYCPFKFRKASGKPNLLLEVVDTDDFFQNNPDSQGHANIGPDGPQSFVRFLGPAFREWPFEAIHTLFLHEFGHVLGLTHSQEPNDLMNHFIRNMFTERDLEPNDIARIQDLTGGNPNPQGNYNQPQGSNQQGNYQDPSQNYQNPQDNYNQPQSNNNNQQGNYQDPNQNYQSPYQQDNSYQNPSQNNNYYYPNQYQYRGYQYQNEKYQVFGNYFNRKGRTIQNTRGIEEFTERKGDNLNLTATILTVMATLYASETRTHDKCTVGWGFLLPKEQTATRTMLERVHNALSKPSSSQRDYKSYILGSIEDHNIVIAGLPKGRLGVVPAASATTHMIHKFIPKHKIQAYGRYRERDSELQEEEEEEGNCQFCDWTKVVPRKPKDMEIYYRLIAPGSQVIRRISDYADSHSNGTWEKHAAAVSAAFARELLGFVTVNDVDAEKSAKEGMEITKSFNNSTDGNRELLIGCAADPEVAGSHNKTLLSYTVEERSAVMRLLLDHGATLETKNHGNIITISYATGGGHEAVVGLLMDYGANLETREF